MTALEIARIAHEVNRAYCEAIGDKSQQPWDQAPDWQRGSALAGVNHIITHGSTPEQSHTQWMAQKLAEGWKHGPEKDAVKKEHPCMVPYEELPLEQKVKDHLFIGTVRACMAKGL